MAHTIKGFQEDQAVLIVERIEQKMGDKLDVDRVVRVLQTYGVVSDHTYWRKLPSVLGALGYDYDEIEEVAP